LNVLVSRPNDDTGRWAKVADGTLEQRYYYCQNSCAGAAAIVNGSGKMMEWVKYSSYGVPIVFHAGDTDNGGGDGDCYQSDINNIDNWVSAYDVHYDLDFDLISWLSLKIKIDSILVR